jgi:hypothetical protein
LREGRGRVDGTGVWETRFEDQIAGAAGTWYMGTSLIRNPAPVGPYRSPMPRALRWSY